MVDVAKVNLYGKTLGMFRWNRRYNVAEFEYAEDFTGKGIEPSPIMMPVREGRVYSFGGLNWDTFNGLPGIDLLAFAASENIKDADSIIGEVCDAAASWPAIAAECGVPEGIINPVFQNFQLDLTQ